MSPIDEKSLDGYQLLALRSAIYPQVGHGIVYPALKLNGEAGEVAELVGKMFRDDGGEMSVERRMKLAHELGDVLWYVAACAKEINYDLSPLLLK